MSVFSSSKVSTAHLVVPDHHLWFKSLSKPVTLGSSKKIHSRAWSPIGPLLVEEWRTPH